MDRRRLCLNCLRTKPIIITPRVRNVHLSFSTSSRTLSLSSNTNQTSPTNESELLYQPLNKIRPPSKTTSSEYLHRIHSLLYPPPASELSALAHRIPQLPKAILTQQDSLKYVEQCLVSSSFWKGIEEGDVKLDDLKKAVSTWKPKFSTSDFEENLEKQKSNELFLPGKLTNVIAPDQSMDANSQMHPFGSERRRKLTEQQKTLDPNLDSLEIDPNWSQNYPKFTNYLDEGQLHNEELATLGNSLLGVLGAEWIDRRYPHLPNKAFQAALTMYVGPRTCADVSRIWGVCSAAGLSNLTIENKPRLENSFAGGAFDIDGLPKNKGLSHKQNGHKGEERSQPGLLRWRRAETALGQKPSGFEQGVLYEDAMASVSRAFVGLVYTLSGMKATREFVAANWLSRKAQVGDLLKFTNPFIVLKYTLAKYGREPPVARLLRESGRASATAMFVVGSYSGSMKLGEAYGTSMKMAEYRAHEDALRRIYLSSSGNESSNSLPSDTLLGIDYIPPSSLGDLEVEEASSTDRSGGRKAEECVEDVLMARRRKVMEKVGLPPTGSKMAL